MNLVEITKALANEMRFDIVRWLRDPETNFRPHKDGKDFSDGVCVAVIQEKCGLSQSTVSHYMAILQRCDLVIATRIGKWTYYRRNDATVRTYLSQLQLTL
ncbi:helix-turn-helix transcriptional regulator [Puniceicoccus vermicola]|uniref:Helix-turn-helix transcriptional regulator n=2 Tax=Puniceicoccus vermicola TaxID=388746 RepID=A0A7X1B0M2_9BACT|nr:helix-turn-helix transcriptional regulator [Puniceicoccus vermicola]